MTHTISRLGSIFEIRKGKKMVEVFSPSDGRQTLRYLQIEDLRNNDNLKFCKGADNAVIAQEDDIIIAWDGANAGTSSYGLEGAIGSTLAVLKKKKEGTDTAYVGRFLQSKQDLLRASCTGATIPHIDRKSLEELLVPLPPLETQKRIADALDKAQELIDKRKRQIEMLDEFLRSVFLDTVGPGASEYATWRKERIEKLAIRGGMRTGPFGSDLLHSEFVDEGIAVLGIDNAVENSFAWGQRRYVTPEKYELLKRYTVYPGDVIVTIMGTTGRSAVIPEDIPPSISSKHLATISLNQEIVDPYFVSFAIHSHPEVLRQIHALNQGAIMSGLNLTKIKALEIPVPPLTLQKQFAELRNHVEQKKSLMRQSLVEMEKAFYSIRQRAFNGELFN